MKLTKIQEAVGIFKDYLTSERAYHNLHIYEGIQNFQENWNLGSDELSRMYLNSTENTTSLRLWRRNDAHPRDIMSAFFHYDPVYTKFMFKDLFNEDLDIASRLDRFTFHSDELFKALEIHFIDGPYNSHFHDKRIASIYLAYHKPSNYLFYDWDVFAEFLPFLEVSEPATYEDPERYYKVSKVLYNFLCKDKDIPTLHQDRLKAGKHYTEMSYSMVYELMEAVNHRPNS